MSDTFLYGDLHDKPPSADRRAAAGRLGRAAAQPAPRAARRRASRVRDRQFPAPRAASRCRRRASSTAPTATLNAARDNVVLLPSHYMANHHGYEWLIGPDRALDPSKLFLVATELFGNGFSSSPSNTPEPFHGPRFPVMTIRDNVEAVHRLLADDLKVTHVRAIIGFSMGAEQAFQWAVSHPAFADRIVATSGTAKAWPHGIVRLEGQIAALTTDPAFNGGDYTSPPQKGHRSLRHGLARLALLAGVVAARAVEDRPIPDRTLAQEIESAPPHVLPEQRRQRSDPAGAHLAAARRRHDARLRRRRRARAAVDHRAGALHAVGDRPLLPGRPTRGTRRSSSRTSRSCRFRRSGDTRPAPAATPPIARFSTRTSARFLLASRSTSAQNP